MVAGRDGAPPLVDLVAGPTTGGVILAFETARQLGVRSIFAEEVRDDDGATRREFRRGFHIEPGERVLLVDDILTTGGSLLAMIPAVEALGGEIVECAVLVDRSGGRPDADLADDRADLPAPLALAARPADLRARRGHVSALRRRHAGVRAWEHRDPSLTRGPTTRNIFLALHPRADRGHDRGASLLLGGTQRPAAGGTTDGPGRGHRRVDSAGLTKVRGFTLRADDGRTLVFDARRSRERGRVPARPSRRAPGAGEPVRVWYRDAGGTLQAIRLEDAPRACRSRRVSRRR